MTTQADAQPPCYYGDYIMLDRLLSCQMRESERRGRPAHDEMLFIVVHQAFELWFKQILHELDRVQEDFSHPPLEDTHLGRIVHGIERINAIFKLVVQQFDVLETMTPLDFLDFRDLLIPASGFQSAQFRMIEIRLGLKTEDRLTIGGRPFDAGLSEADRARIERALGAPKLIDQLGLRLARTPFVEQRDYVFHDAYRDAVVRMLEADVARIHASAFMSESQRETELNAIVAALERFNAIFSREEGQEHWRLSLAAVQAALFIAVYRDQPVLQLPFRLLAALMDVEESLRLWRYRHALMVQRMIGVKVGTGGSSGYEYLSATADRHRIFNDLFQLATYLIPRSALPPLPLALRERMGFVYADRTKP
jgi:tryptophan 2,3-dioxygenase